MKNLAIKVERLFKEYKLGVVNHGVLFRDLQSWFAKIQGKEDPNSIISSKHSKSAESESFLALDDLSFEVSKGDVLGIIGRNGAGKSTLLKILSRITSPSSGLIGINGRLASLLEVGTGFHPELTGRENIFMNGAILGMRNHEISSKIDDIISFSEIEKFIDTPVKRYSSGMYIRLAFAIAAHLSADILLVDEVLAVGDVQFQRKCLGKMNDVAKNQGRTVIFVSHNMGAVQQLCGIGLLLVEGKKKIEGNIGKVLDCYTRLIQDQSFSNINQRTDRSGNGSATIETMYILNSSKQNVREIGYGEPFEIFIEIKFSKKMFKQRYNINLSITDRFDNRLIPLQSKVEGAQFSNASEVECIICKVEHGISLLPGDYSITFSIFVNDILSDKIYMAYNFTINSNKKLKVNTIPDDKLGFFYVKSNWRKQ